ncbi:MAG: hypothetical protein FGM32_02185 [Candidatus Kapabacteria bacterium]|nr:hypothetical protein [Candidatus Kapabacteria bacterium]
MANKSLNQRILDLSHEELVSAVLAAIESDPRTRRLFATLTATRKDRISAIKGDISKFGHSGGKGRDHTAKQTAAFVASVVDRIEHSCGDDPDEAFTLLSRLLVTQTSVQLRVRQSFEPIREVYDDVVIPALVKVAHRVRSATILASGLSELLAVHHIRGVWELFEHVGAEFPDETVDAVLALVATARANKPNMNGIDISDSYHELTGTILSSTGRIEEFLRHATVDGEIDALHRIKLVEMHLDHEDFKGARQHLDQLSDIELTLYPHADAVLERYLRECTDLANREEFLRKLIVEYNRVQFADEYRKLYGAEALARLMEQAMKRVRSGKDEGPTSVSMLGLLVHEGYAEEISKHVEKQILNGLPPWDIDSEYVVELAEGLSIQGYPRAAVLLLRRILWELMELGPNAYDAAAWLYLRIHELSLSVKDWDRHEKQKDFIVNFRLKYVNKRTFWKRL